MAGFVWVTASFGIERGRSKLGLIHGGCHALQFSAPWTVIGALQQLAGKLPNGHIKKKANKGWNLRG